MKMKKTVSAIAALAMAASTLVGMATMASAAENTIVDAVLVKSASGQNDSSTLVLNLDLTTDATPVTFNSNSGTWKGVAVLEFEVPAVDPNTIVGSTLNVSLHNKGNRGGNRTYNICKSTNVDLTAATTVANVLGANGAVLYTGAALKDGSYRNDSISDDAITEYIKSNVSETEPTHIQLAFTNAAQQFEILMAPDAKLADSAAPTLSLTTTNAQLYNVTVNTTYGDEVLSTASYKAQSGEAFTPEYTNSFDRDGYRYTYVSGGDTLESVNADTVINLVYDRRALMDTKLTINAVVGGEVLEEIKAVDLKEGVSSKVAYPKYILKDGKLYTTPQGPSSGYYSKDVVGIDKDQVLDIEYSEVADASAVFYAEGEDIFTNNNVTNAAIRCSTGAGGDVTEKTEIVTLPAGVYKLSTAVWGGGKAESNQSTYTFTAGEAELGWIATTGSLVQSNIGEFTLTEETTIAVEKTVKGTSGACIDYVLIEKTGDVEPPVPAEIEGTIEVVGTYEGEQYFNVATALTATFANQNNDVTYTTVTIAAEGAESQTDTVDITNAEVIFGIVVDKIVDASIFTATMK